MAGAGVGTSLDLPCLLQARKMTKLEDYMVGVINIFHQYSIRKGNFDTLSKGELMQLMTQELPNVIKVGDASLSQTCPRRMTVGQGLRWGWPQFDVLTLCPHWTGALPPFLNSTFQLTQSPWAWLIASLWHASLSRRVGREVGGLGVH